MRKNYHATPSHWQVQEDPCYYSLYFGMVEIIRNFLKIKSKSSVGSYNQVTSKIKCYIWDTIYKLSRVQRAQWGLSWSKQSWGLHNRIADSCCSLPSAPGGMKSPSHALSHLILIRTVWGSYPCFTDEKTEAQEFTILSWWNWIRTQFVWPQSLNSSTTKLYQTLGKLLGWIREVQDQEWRLGYPRAHRERQIGRKQIEM